MPSAQMRCRPQVNRPVVATNGAFRKVGEAMKQEGDHGFYLNEEVFIEPASGASGFLTHIVGLKPDQYLILDHPGAESDAASLKVDDKIKVRCFQVTACRFETSVLHLIREPIPLLFLNYPDTIDAIDRRQSERKKIFIRGTYLDVEDHKGKRSWEGYILDISDSGCLMWGDFVHLVDREILLTFQIPWTGERIQVKARVMRCEVTDKGMLSGLKFTALVGPNRERLQELIHSLKDDEISRIVATDPSR